MSKQDSKTMQSRSLIDWLCYIEQQHPANIELGLERVGQVAKAAKLTHFSAQVITVAGTNGKGTTCAVMENILLQSSKRVGVYSSPHLHDYRERVRIDGKLPDEQQFCDAFAEIEQIRQDLGLELTYFEFGTLAALSIFSKMELGVIILEVGLGGRLDATNIVESDIAVVTTVDLDHSDWLGSTRELVGYEKAGVFRAHKPVVCGDLDPPQSLIKYANKLSCQCYFAGQDFSLSDACWQWHRDDEKQLAELPNLGFVPTMNIATALAVLELLPFSFSHQAIRQGISHTQLPGRMQQVQACPLVIADVAHNAQATAYMAGQLSQQRESLGKKRVLAVVGMLADKDSRASLLPLSSLIDEWYVCDLDCTRAATASELQVVLQTAASRVKVSTYESVLSGFKTALSNAHKDDLLIVFGSFYTVADLLNYYKTDSFL